MSDICLFCLNDIQYTINSKYCQCTKIPIHQDCMNEIIIKGNILCPYCKINNKPFIPHINYINNWFDNIIYYINLMIDLPFNIVFSYPNYITIFIFFSWVISLLFLYFLPYLIICILNSEYKYYFVSLFIGLVLIF